jgi:hypothetical protein
LCEVTPEYFPVEPLAPFVHGSCTEMNAAFIQNARPNRNMQSDLTLAPATQGVA